MNGQIQVNPETTPARIAHARIPNCFWNEDQKEFVRDRKQSTLYTGSKERFAGVDSIKEKYPKATMKHLIYNFVVS